MENSVTERILKVAENICDNFCRYQQTCDENNECEWMRMGNDCPLDELV